MAYFEYKKLIVWQKAMRVVEEVYLLTRSFPKEETYGLTSQIKRASVSIPSNIAEGTRRQGQETKQFLRFAFASGAEVETQLEIGRRLGFVTKKECQSVDTVLDEVMKILNVMISK